jgi:hypothetical protein
VTSGLARMIRDALAAQPRERRLSAALAVFTHFAEEERGLFVQLYHSGLLGDPEFGDAVEGVRREIEDLLLEGQERTPQLIVGLRGVMGYVEAATVRWLQLPPGTMTEAEVAFLIETVLRTGLDRIGRFLDTEAQS